MRSKSDKLQIFIIMFFISLIMSVQGPIFAPYAAMLGASSVFIGVMLSASQFANLTGNLIVGPLVDQFGKKLFITLPLFVSGFLYMAHGFISTSESLLVLRTLNGFSLAFLMPAALAFLSGYAKTSRQQGKNMAINGMLGMLASIIAPLIGGKLGATLGYPNTYLIIGTSLILAGVYAVGFLNDNQPIIVKKNHSKSKNFVSILGNSQLQLVYVSGFAVMYIHGVILYEVPYLTVELGISTINTGQLFSFMAIGTLVALSLFFIHRFNPVKRIMFGLFCMCISLFVIINGLLGLPIILFFIGMCFGIIMPAMATAITDAVTGDAHGTAFGVMSAVYSLGMIVSSSITAVIRDLTSPYFIAFLVGMFMLTFVGYLNIRNLNAIQSKI